MKILLTATLTLLLLTGCSDSSQAQVLQKKEKQQKKEIVLQNINGEKIEVIFKDNKYQFKGYEGKIVLLDFFATWCPPCIAEIPHLNKIQEKYKKDVVIISLLLEENKTKEDINAFIQKNDIKFIVTHSTDNYKLAKKIGGVKSIPFMIMYNKEGNYSQHYTGAIPQEMIEADLKKLLVKKEEG